MPRLLLLRHAKAAAGSLGAPDFDRPLTAQGRRSATLVGEHIARHRLEPDRILCSTSRRTRETLAALLPHLAGDADMRMARILYEPAAGHYCDIVGRYGLTANTLLVIGHNPGMQETAEMLIGSGSGDLREAAVTRFSTAALAVIDFEETRWDEVVRNSGRIVAFFRPRDLELVGGEGGGDDT
ncbi:MAG: histidine phosphatase family protein [Bauldia sp.]|nr:histidine phosphatase family protein [Bauldia sp.]